MDNHAPFDGSAERDQQSFEPTLVTPETDNNGDVTVDRTMRIQFRREGWALGRSQMDDRAQAKWGNIYKF